MCERPGSNCTFKCLGWRPSMTTCRRNSPRRPSPRSWSWARCVPARKCGLPWLTGFASSTTLQRDMMFTNKEINSGLTEATQLTRTGRILEATALIQRLLGHSSAPAEGANRHASDGGRGASNTIDVESSDITERSHRGTSAHQGPARDDIARRFSLESLAREGRRRDVLDVPPGP